jgi:3-oxoacyl-[acyl-carrier protein] reductase
MEGELGALKTKEEVEKKGVEANAWKVDITDVEKVKEAVKEINQTLGTPEILINSAACVDHTAKVLDQDPAKWERDLKVNLTGQFNMVRAVLPGMLEKKWGRIVNFASVAGTLGGYGQLSYSTTKAGMVGFTKTIALEFARYGITCNCIVPGLIETEVTKFMSPETKERIAKRTAFRKLGEPQDIAYTIAFLVSEKAKYITGETIYVDGGIQLFTF